LKTANLAIVFTDIKGFTERTSRQTLEENQRLLQVHEALLVPLFKAFGGRIIKSIGDAFLVTFESPTQAVLSGIAIQDRLWHHNRELLADDQIHVRVAVNVGEVRLENNDIFGEPVNIAARVEGITEADEVFFTEAVYLSMNKAEVPSQEVGAFELKGIPGRIRVFRVPRAPYRVEAPAPDAVVSPEEEAALPPFGNLALSRVTQQLATEAQAVPSSSGQGAMVAAQLGQGAVVLGQRAAVGAVAVGQGAVVLGQRAAVGAVAVGRRAHVVGSAFWSGMRETYSRMPPEQRRVLSLGGLGLVAVVLLAVFGVGWVRGAPLRTLRAVEGTEGAEKVQRVAEAQRVIDAEADPARKLYFTGVLSEAQGKPADAVSEFAQATKKGNADAEARLIAMLGHENCWVRVAAARSVGELKLQGARGDLKSLAESGGADDGRSSGRIFKTDCNSKKTAKSVLEALESR
jgi:adenylate cyclase